MHLKDDCELFAVINNAGINDACFAEWALMEGARRVFEVNFFGALRVTKAFLPLLRKSKGRIINVCSTAALEPSLFAAFYSPSKAALANFDKLLRRDMYQFDVKVISILPNCFKTNCVDFEAMKRILSKRYHDCPDELKLVYDENLVNGALVTIKNTGLIALPDLSKVTRAVNLAATLLKPEHSYFPHRPVVRAAFWFGMEFLPLDLFELLFKVNSMMMPLARMISGDKVEIWDKRKRE